MAVDNTVSKFSGTIYVTWTHFTTLTDVIWLSKSTNHGVTWSPPIQVNPREQNGIVQGSQIAVGPDGSVYVAWGFGDEACGGGTYCQHFVAKSTDGGKTFGAAVPMAPAFMPLSFFSSYRINSFPSLAVSPVAGKDFVYDIYPTQNGANSRIAFVRSTTPGGVTFTPPVSVNDSKVGQRCMPAVTVDTTGVAHLSWFDSRNGFSADTLDIFATFTKNNGATFAPNARLTSGLINATDAQFIGDYSGIAASPSGLTRYAHPVWTNGGLSANGQLSTATLTLP